MDLTGICQWLAAQWIKVDLGSLPQWATALTALGALGAAVWSVGSQREIARKRAAIDFFIKTEMDKETLDSHGRFTAGVKALKEHGARDAPMDEFAKTTHYGNIRAYLNLHELMAVGITQRVFDDHVCYFFWSGELRKACWDTKGLVEFIQKLPDERRTYIELAKVHKRWLKRDKKEDFRA